MQTSLLGVRSSTTLAHFHLKLRRLQFFTGHFFLMSSKVVFSRNSFSAASSFWKITFRNVA